MRTLGKWLGRAISLIVVVVAGLWLLGPQEPSDLTVLFDETVLDQGIEEYLSSVESRFSDIKDGVEKQVIWATAEQAKTDWAVLYIHGFSATSQEIRPVPDIIADALGANLVLTRLEGHGRGGDAMAEATVSGWMNDTAEALAIARRVGDRVLILSTSTGGTLVAAAAQDPNLMKQVAGSVFVAPNFGVNNPAAPLLTWPAARYWLPLLVGETRTFEPRNPGQGTYWTTEYPSVAVLPMAALVKEVVDLDHSRASIPALFWFSDADKVVVPERTREVAAAWGGDVQIVNPNLSDTADPYAHVIAGDIMSPDDTVATVSGILDWVGGL